MTDQLDDWKASLSAKQLVAIEAIANGASKSEAAKTARVDRATVGRWADNPIFSAALAELMNEKIAAISSRANELTFKALEVVEGGLAAGDVRVALDYLKLTGISTAVADHRQAVQSMETNPQAAIAKLEQAESSRMLLDLFVDPTAKREVERRIGRTLG